jgi:hypothetical protein
MTFIRVLKAIAAMALYMAAFVGFGMTVLILLRDFT